MKKEITIYTTTKEELQARRDKALEKIQSKQGKRLTDFGAWCLNLDKKVVEETDKALAMGCDEIVEMMGNDYKLGETITFDADGYTIEIKVTKK